MKILVVEDEKRLAETIHALLCKHGFEVDPASDGEAGLSFAGLRLHNLILLDIFELILWFTGRNPENQSITANPFRLGMLDGPDNEGPENRVKLP